MTKLLGLSLILSWCLLSACQEKSSQANMRVSSVPERSVKEVKPGAKVSLASENIVTLTAGNTATVDILLNAQLGDGNMHVELNPSEGLQLQGSSSSYDFTPTADGQYKISPHLYTPVDGRYYLNINATITAGDVLSSRSLAVIVQVGAIPSTAESPAKSLQKTSGENVVSLPAQERIINQ